MRKCLIVVDVQNDFVEGGSLACEGGKNVADKINQLLLSEHDYDLVVSSQDWHKANDSNGGHISDNPDYVDTWPVHCIEDTFGADYCHPINADLFNYRFLKGQGFPAYSAFEGIASDSDLLLLELLKNSSVTHVDVVGIATDHCVFATARDALESEFNVSVLTEYCTGVGEETSRNALAKLAELGATIVL